MAVRDALGAELVWYSEYEPPTARNPNPSQAAARLLAHRHPAVPNLGDVTAIDWQEVRAMAWPRHDQIACDMYSRYQQGLSLAQVAAEFNRSPHYNGTVPPGYDIHHKDEDKTNNALSNLECLPKPEHTRLYSPNCNQFSHKCGCDEEVMPQEAPAVDVLTGGFP